MTRPATGPSGSRRVANPQRVMHTGGAGEDRRVVNQEIKRALFGCRTHIAAAGAFSLGINLLYLSIPLYMLQVYDRVLASGSTMTLLMLTLACLLALLTLAALDIVRAR